MRRILSFLLTLTSSRETTISADPMNFDIFFNRPATSGSAPTNGIPGITLAGFGCPDAGVRRQSLATRTCGLPSVILFAAALTISGRSYADSIPAPFGSMAVNSGPGTDQTVAGSGDLSLTSNTSGTNPDFSAYQAYAAATEYGMPASFLSVYVGGEDQFVPDSPAAQAEMLYYFDVKAPEGASPTKTVPLRVTYLIGTIFNSDETDPTETLFKVEGLVQLFDTVTGSSSLSNICAATGNTVCSSTQVSSPSISVDQDMLFQPGDLEGVEMFAYISFQGTSLAAESSKFDGYVAIDPTFTIDPAFLAENPGYSLEFSPGIGDTPVGEPTAVADPTAVPEPATWSMMLIGLGGLGAAIRIARHSHLFYLRSPQPQRSSSAHSGEHGVTFARRENASLCSVQSFLS